MPTTDEWVTNRWEGNPWTVSSWFANSPAMTSAIDSEGIVASQTDIDAFRKTLSNNSVQSLSEVDNWYTKYVYPERTVGEGRSSPATWDNIVVAGWTGKNTPDPDGVCGDTIEFVRQMYDAYMPSAETSDGFVVGLVVWQEDAWTEGTSLESTFRSNHVAVIMIPEDMTYNLVYSFDSSTSELVGHNNNPSVDSSDVIAWHVYDLYKKYFVLDLYNWWDKSKQMQGTITISKYL